MKFKHSVFFFCTLLFSFLANSCSKNEEKIPKDVLSPDEMVPLLIDMHIAQAAVSVFQYSDTIRYNNTELSVYILKKRKIEPEKYLRSMKYYSARPDQLSEIYQHVIDELSKTQGMQEHSGRK
ncbi:MAG: DUF4296 domain-containing protein [Bacteroidetes bacterium]|jgi:hypothetical protein|nr:DUF4296 domain-containing protein [Bacteroidota bacterium]MBP6402813.1 DUF4296 domain-containing protein [Bacteroidia bacterium]MBK6836993.1 DUF4296 domain-containing protein [Bacteroidota bacterium]MBK9523605.1 DUF4296 domain-containing protein [Bacteroidota bacterium]MBK9541353.1 DUF4296 domain-containing protein [Bacteroidota bacterium]